jgi:hypothetical protein
LSPASSPRSPSRSSSLPGVVEHLHDFLLLHRPLGERP